MKLINLTDEEIFIQDIVKIHNFGGRRSCEYEVSNLTNQLINISFVGFGGVGNKIIQPKKSIILLCPPAIRDAFIIYSSKYTHIIW
jgi:hypothetical protein